MTDNIPFTYSFNKCVCKVTPFTKYEMFKKGQIGCAINNAVMLMTCIDLIKKFADEIVLHLEKISTFLVYRL